MMKSTGLLVAAGLLILIGALGTIRVSPAGTASPEPVAKESGVPGSENGKSPSPGAAWALLPGADGNVTGVAVQGAVPVESPPSATVGESGVDGAAPGAGGSTPEAGRATASGAIGTTPPAAAGGKISTPPPEAASAAPAISSALATGSLAPNRMGVIPILEFHNLGAKDGRWSSSWESFRHTIQTLYDEGFRPVNLVDVVDRRIELPRGFAPVVLTFDDGDPAQFQWGPEGSAGAPAPESAVGILYEFHRAHPDWGLRATFFVNRPAFGQESEAKLRWLVANGFEVGDHTLDHVPMRGLSAAQMLHEVGGLAAWVQQTVPGYQIATLAFPDGVAQNLPQTTWNGTVNGQAYAIRAAVLVGAGPAPSPYSSHWNPQAIPRIQVANPALVPESDRNFVWASWEKRLLAHPEQLYIADGAGGVQQTGAAGGQPARANGEAGTEAGGR